MWVNAYLKAYGRPEISYYLELLFRERSYSFAAIISVEFIFIQGSSPFTKNIIE